MRRAHSHAIHRAAAALAGAVVLTACAGNVNSGALGGGTALQAPVASSAQAAIHNLAGQYSGTDDRHELWERVGKRFARPGQARRRWIVDRELRFGLAIERGRRAHVNRRSARRRRGGEYE